jgi:hypothetical protein
MTLRVMLTPDGNTTVQIKITLNKANIFLTKMKRSCLPAKAKWTALSSVLKPCILYPLMACSITDKEMDSVDKILSKAKCHSLGLNEHFPRAILHGPTHLGGMGIPLGRSKKTTSLINIFLHHTHLQTEIGRKLEASIAYLQIEIGILSPFHQHYKATMIFLWSNLHLHYTLRKMSKE